MLSGIVLDLDGTLVDSNYLHVEAYARAFLEADRAVPRAVLHKQIGKGADQFLPDLVGNRQLAEQVDARHKELYRSMSGYAYPLPGARELLAHLREIGLQVWLGTSAQPEEAEQHLEALGARGRLTGTVMASEVDASKPAPDIFQAVLARSALSADQTVVLGDTIWDVESAAGAGLRTIGLLTGGAFSAEELKQAGAIAVFEDCATLLASGFPNGF
ncbi:MAG: HAD family hydrolase [Chloroflexi bacterium]|nr:HAD family hydrolase [Chloroflexota bacterium]MBV9599063.1 HAD family hydrolase [Chloroflexota bacterium]